MDQRLKIQKILEGILESKEVYFQPPENVRMKYPCFVYSLSGSESIYADDLRYYNSNRYTVTYITRNPDDGMYEKIMSLTNWRFDRPYTSDGLHHFTFTTN